MEGKTAVHVLHFFLSLEIAICHMPSERPVTKTLNQLMRRRIAYTVLSFVYV